MFSWRCSGATGVSGDVIVKIERNISRNQSPTAKYQKGTVHSSDLGNQFAFLTSGQREEVQKVLYKIKGTGRKIPEDKKIVIEDVQNADQIIANLFNIKEQISAAMEIELKQQLISFVKQVLPLYGLQKSNLLDQLGDSIKKGFQCLDEEAVRVLLTNLQYGGTKDLTQEDLERVLVDVAGVELTTRANQGFFSSVSIASDYLYEKMHDLLKNIADELLTEATQETSRQEEEKLAAQKAKISPRDKPPSPRDKPVENKPIPPSSKKPVPPPKSAKPAPKTPAKGQKPDPVVQVEVLPKVESNLSHATKDRPAMQQKRPPTRKPRPAPPPETKV